MTGKLWFRLALGFGLSAIFLVLIATRVDLRDLARRLEGADAGDLALGVAALLAGYACRSLRWAVMLRALPPRGGPRAGIKVGYLRPAQVLLAATALNNLLPLRGGEVFRVVALHRHVHGGAPAVAVTLLAERLLDGFILLLFLLPTISAIPLGVGGPLLVRFGQPVVVAAAVFVGSGLILGRWALSFLAGIRTRSRLGRAVRRGIIRALSAAHAVLSPKRLTATLLLGVLAWSAEALAFLAVAAALDIPLGFGGSMLTMVCGTLATILPSGPGFLGAFDYAVVTALEWRGFGASAGAAYTVLVHAELWLPITLAGLACLTALPGRGRGRGRGHGRQDGE